MPDFPIPQGSIIPSIFIGLGGTGSRIVDHIATRAMGLPHWESHLSPLTQFICVDTNAMDQNKLTRVPANNRILISAFDKRRAVSNYREAEDMKALQWLDRNYVPREGIKPGAGQIRVESRLAFHFNSPAIRTRLLELITNTLAADNPYRQSDPHNFFVYIYAGVGGGTGSGSFLPMAYLVSDIVTSLQWQPRILGYFPLSTLMTKNVQPHLHPAIHANSYAALKELEHMTKLDYPESLSTKTADLDDKDSEEFVFWNNHADNSLPRVRSRPFFLSFIVDRSERLELPALEATLGDATFLEIFSPVLGDLYGEVDNYEKELTALTQTPGKYKAISRGYTKHFGALGVSALVLPAFELLEYCALRFAAEALRQQITFGASETSSAVDAKLADLRVNYDDPKFSRLSEGERQAAINESFILSMQAMAAEDERDGFLEGIWYKLVEEVDTGAVTGKDEQGQEQRTETLVQRMLRLLDEKRSPILAKVSIPATNLIAVNRESLGNYNDVLNKFTKAIATANVAIEEGAKSLRSSASQGDCIELLNPRLSPLQERYLVIRLVKQMKDTLIPEAENKLKAAVARSFKNPKVQEKFSVENMTTLADAAAAKRFGMFPDRDAFTSVRDGVQSDFQQTATAQKAYYDAELKLAQYRSLLDYLEGRARQFATLATRMHVVVNDLDRQAENIRSGIAVDQPRYAMSVEVFETMDAPKTRKWREVFYHLFVKGGKGQATFDRQMLANAIAQQLRPVQNKATGKYVPKEDYILERDLKATLTDLGRSHLRADIYGDKDRAGLTIETGIELEALICLASGTAAEVRDEVIAKYVDRKLRAFESMSGVYARLSQADALSMGDGVKLSKSRHVVLDRPTMTPGFVAKVTSLLSRDGATPTILDWTPIPNRHIAIAHDITLPIPLYYFIPIIGELEAAYEQVAANPGRSYNLHTDFNWELTLPNLNPSKAKMSTGWAIDLLIQGLLMRVIVQGDEGFKWPAGNEVLGLSLSSALYRLGEFHRDEHLRKQLSSELRAASLAVTAEEITAREKKVLEQVNDRLTKTHLAARKGLQTREEKLDEPIWRVFGQRLEESRAARDANAQHVDGVRQLSGNLEV